MMQSHYDLVVIGGGPAGMAAASTAAKHHDSILLIDAADKLGGNYFKPLPDAISPVLSRRDTQQARELQSRIEKLSGVDVLSSAQVWGIFQGDGATSSFSLHLDPAETIIAQSLIIATGVYDRPIPFPGWTLPGVMTPGGAQVLIKKQGILPGQRVLVAGTGPLQLVVAATLASAGAKVVALADPSAAMAGFSRLPSAMWGQWDRLGELGEHLWALLRHRVPMLFRHIVLQAIGAPGTGVQQAVVGRVDAKGYPIKGTKKTMDVDLICAAYGFMPDINLTVQLGCDHEYDAHLVAYVPTHDERMQTSVDGIFVAGDMTGVGGKALAELQGQLAGISALEMLGILTLPKAEAMRAQLQPAIVREMRFANWLWQRWRNKPGFWQALDDETVVCRCEGVTAVDIRQSCANGAKTMFGTKLRTRLGMGVCQGRYCATNAAILMAQTLNCPVTEVGLPNIRPPVMPVRIGTIAEDG
ncbi:MAG: FAD-dependent oxidoreductase [Chloroflexi bacterium]|nr:FAD-dependent oxidoreductase [Chloroflexota bacterium]